MSIKPLPPDTSRLLGSSTLIATPVSLVKELVDNAIDARAKSIEVLISPNTVDKIEVRDDGHGIQPIDWEALGRRGHTSKLTRFEDLKEIGGTTLGFRGEGLASANTLGYVAITTRTAKDKVATTFRLAAKIGGVSAGSKKVSSAPPGTTVAATCLFSSLPVRRKVAVQDAAKTMAAIKNLLCSYALARPSLRLSFKVFQQPAQAWTYVPPPAAATSRSMREPVLALFGSNVARPCFDTATCVGDLVGDQPPLSQSMSEGGSDEIVFEAYFPNPGTDLTRLAIGGFVSVDGRPLSSQHQGVAKKLLGIFRGHLTKSMDYTHPRQVRDAFICLNIKCPAGSYDPNVESSKTDVLFAEEKLICDAFERLCHRVYGEAERERSRQAQIQNARHQQQHMASSVVVSQPSTAVPCTPTQEQTVPFTSTPSYGSRRPQQPLGANRSISDVIRSPNNRQGSRVASYQSMRSPISQLRSMFGDGETARQGPGTGSVRSRHSNHIQRQRIPPSLIGARIEERHERHTLPQRGIQRSGILARHSRLMQRPGCRKSRPAEGLQTPPSSSPPESREGAGHHHLSGQRATSPDPALPGAVTTDGLRQTTLSFRAPLNNGHIQPERQIDCQVSSPLTPPKTAMQAQRVSADGMAPQSFMTATNFCRVTGVGADLVQSGQQQQPLSELTFGAQGDARQEDVSQRTRHNGATETTGATLGEVVAQRRRPGRPDNNNSKRKPIYVMEVELSRLERGMARFVSCGDAKGRLDCLFSDTADVSRIKRRLREAVTNWLTRTRTGEQAQSPVKVEFYFRRSLKERVRRQLRKSETKVKV